MLYNSCNKKLVVGYKLSIMFSCKLSHRNIPRLVLACVSVINSIYDAWKMWSCYKCESLNYECMITWKLLSLHHEFPLFDHSSSWIPSWLCSLFPSICLVLNHLNNKEIRIYSIILYFKNNHNLTLLIPFLVSYI